MVTALDIALDYVKRQWNPVPIRFRTKIPIGDDWQKREINAESAATYFSAADPQNVGVLLGPTSRGLTDVDLDAAEAAAVAPYLLPITHAVFGRASKRASHWLYVTDLAANVDTAVINFNDPDGGRLLELRIGGEKGAQTVFPGSIHESGEPVAWEETGEPSRVDGSYLEHRVRLVAVASLLVRCWPGQGARHQAALTVGGFLGRARLPTDEIALIVEAVARAAGDSETKDRVRAAKDNAQHHEETGHGFGLPALVRLAGEKAARRIADWLGYRDRQSEHETASIKVPKPAPWPELPGQALHGLAADLVTSLAPQTESDPVALLLQFLISFGNAIGRGPYYKVEADRHFTNLFGVFVGQSSKSRKGTSAGRIREIMKIADQEWATHRCQGGMSSGEGVIWAIRDPIYKYKKGKRELDDGGVQDKRLLLDEREFFSALAVMKREGNILSRVIRDAWDGRDHIASLTKNSPACATEPMISISAHITEEELVRSLDHTSMANGYANRFLFVAVRRARVLPHGGNVDEATVQKLGVATGRALHVARRISRITMTAAAARAWEAVYPALSEGQPGLLGAIIGRAEAQTIRLAMLYALLDGCDQIDLAHLEAGISVWEYCESSAKRIFGDLVGDPVADDILRALRKAGPDGMTRTELHSLFGRHRVGASIGAGVGSLGKVRCERRKGAGRTTEIWIAC